VRRDNYVASFRKAEKILFITRRIADKQVLQIIKRWLTLPVIETKLGGRIQSTAAKDNHRGIPQGGLCKALHNVPYANKNIMQSKHLIH